MYTELEGSFVNKQNVCGFCFSSIHCLKLSFHKIHFVSDLFVAYGAIL